MSSGARIFPISLPSGYRSSTPKGQQVGKTITHATGTTRVRWVNGPLRWRTQLRVLQPRSGVSRDIVPWWMHATAVMCCRGFRCSERGMANTAQLCRLIARGRAESGPAVRGTVPRACDRSRGAKHCITISSAQVSQSTGRSEGWPVIHRSARQAPTCRRESVVSGAGR